MRQLCNGLTISRLSIAFFFIMAIGLLLSPSSVDTVGPPTESFCACDASKSYCGLEKAGDTEADCQQYIQSNGLTDRTDCVSIPYGSLCSAIEVSGSTQYCACKQDKSDCGISKVNTKQKCQDILSADNVTDRECVAVASSASCTSLVTNAATSKGSSANSTFSIDDIEKTYGTPAGYIGPIPPCAFKGTCRDVNDLIFIFVRFGEMTLGIVGTFAFAFFIYGGFTMIMSMGSTERVKKGRDILIAAVIGIIISFAAFILVDFLRDALSVRDTFRVIN